MEEDLIKKKDLLDPLDDDDDIEWKHNPFDADHVSESGETPEELLAKITFEGSEYLQTKLKALVLEFIDVFATKVRRTPAEVEPMKISIVETAMQQSSTPTTFRREAEGDQEASGCTAELRRHQRIAGLGVESSPLGTETHT